MNDVTIVRAVFNMLQIPPLDGGWKRWHADPAVGLDLDIIATFLRTATFYVIRLLLMLTGNA